MTVGLPLLIIYLAAAPVDQADRLYASGAYGEAAAAYSQLLQIAPADIHLLDSMGHCLLALGQPTQAASLFRRELSLQPMNREAADLLGQSLQEANNLAEGRAFLLTQAATDPGNPEPHFRLGLLLYQNGYYAAAVESLDRAKALPLADRNRAAITRAICLVQMGRGQDAEKPLRDLLSLPANRQNLDLLLALARLLYESGRYDEALSTAIRAAGFDSRNASTHFWQARILQQQGKLSAAAGEAERSRDLAPESPAPHNLLLRLYQKLGRTEDGAREAAWLRARQ